MAGENRPFHRLPEGFKVFAALGSEDTLSEREALDLNAKGLSFFSPRRMRPKEAVELQLQWSPRPGEIVPVFLRGRVVETRGLGRSAADGARYLTAVQFASSGPQTARAMARLLGGRT